MNKLRSLEITPRYEAESSWWEHVPIAHLLTEQLKPKIIVELGSHYGVSLFSFCEAAETLGIETHIYGIDTWQGDEQAGYYGDDVYNKVRTHLDQFHKQRASLLRCLFDEAVKNFQDKSIDLLHIDGLHTYDAVKHDFLTWKPKLHEEGTILFHDINVREKNFGVWKLWEEIKRDNEFLYFEFNNGHGLGIATRYTSKSDLLDLIKENKKILQCKGLLLDKLNEKRNEIIRKGHENELKKKHAKNLENMLFAKERELKDAARQINELIARRKLFPTIKRMVKNLRKLIA